VGTRRRRAAAPNVVAVYDASADGTCYVVMELLAGPSLSSSWPRGPPLADMTLGYAERPPPGSPSRTPRAWCTATSGINLVLDGDGTLKVVDFGIASRRMRPAR
jgi:serine/threonine protein kinase